jgi:MFS family permease
VEASGPAFQANYVDYLFRLPQIVWSLQQHHPHAWLPALSFAFGAGVFLYVKSLEDDLTLRRSIALILIGVATFVLGYAIFFTNRAIQITPTGIGNRTANAASLGVAMTSVGVLGLIAAAVRRPSWRRLTFGVLIGAYAGAGLFVIGTLSSFWIDAYAREQEIVRDIAAHIDTPAPQILLLLGGICSYDGPAVIFESDWDLAGALRLHYGDRTVRADVLRPGFYRVTASGITTFLYGEQDDDAFGPQMVLYDYRRKMSHVLVDADTAERIFREQPPDADCPPGMEGVGVRVF